MRCRECDTPNPPERTRCAKCGAKLPPPPGGAKPTVDAPPVKPRRRPREAEEVEEEEGVERRPRRRREEDYDEEEERRPRRRRDEEEEEDEDDDREEEPSAWRQLVPSGNKAGLVAYYCAIFSLIPAVVFPIPMLTDKQFPDEWNFILLPLPITGTILGLLGVVFGIIGLVHARTDRRAKGGGHAGTGLFLGAFTFLECAIMLMLYFAGILPHALF